MNKGVSITKIAIGTLFLSVILVLADLSVRSDQIKDLEMIARWQGALAQLPPEAAFILTEDEALVELGAEYDLPVFVYVELQFHNGKIVSYQTSHQRSDSNWYRASEDSTIYFLNADGDLLTAYEPPAGLKPDKIWVRLAPQNAKFCLFAYGMSALPSIVGPVYIYEFYSSVTPEGCVYQ
ncbi:MAG: hypothetical protein HYV90_05940 [Candidatus Woesebacteria bacterium]|nr:MAG: hypothetical protein HYV90_05940 [Candidatus Woesebacteria bacterium]